MFLLNKFQNVQNNVIKKALTKSIFHLIPKSAFTLKTVNIVSEIRTIKKSIKSVDNQEIVDRI